MPRLLWIGDDDPCNPGRAGWDFAPLWCRAWGFGQVVVTAANQIAYGSTGAGWTLGPDVPGGYRFAGVPLSDSTGAVLAQDNTPPWPDPSVALLSHVDAYHTSGTVLTFEGPGTLDSHWKYNDGVVRRPADDSGDVGFFAYEYVGPFPNLITSYQIGYYAVPSAFPLHWPGTPPDFASSIEIAPVLLGDAAQPWFATAAGRIGYAGQLFDTGGELGVRWELFDDTAGVNAAFWTGSYIGDTYLWVGGTRTAIADPVDHWVPRAWEFNGGSWFEHSPPIPPGYGRVYLAGLHTNGSTDTWAVGWKTFASSGPRTSLDPGQIYIAHWDGSAWTVLDTPCWDGGSYLTAIHGLGPHDIWTVGTEGGGTNPIGFLALHWDGTRWRDASP